MSPTSSDIPPLDLSPFKKKLHDLLIAENGNIGEDDMQYLRKEAKELDLDERHLNQLLQEENSNINWDFIHRQQELEKQEADKKIEDAKKAKEIIKFIVKQYASDGVFDQIEVRNYFQTAEQLKMDEDIIARSLKTYFEVNNFIPVYPVIGQTLRHCLESTEWRQNYVRESLNTPVVQGTTVAPSQRFEELLDTSGSYVRSDVDFRAYSPYYQAEFRKIFESNEVYKGEWNWFGFLFPCIWCIAKGCWGIGIIIFVCLLVTYGTWLNYTLLLIAALFIGARGNWLYYNIKIKQNHLPKIF